jgi:DNA polymerase-3 subunit alpha
MCIILIDDATAQLEVAVYSELFERKRAMLKEDQLVFVTGRARFDEFAQRLALSADDIVDLAEARAQAQAALSIRVDARADPRPLGEVLAAYRAAPMNAGANSGGGAGGGASVAGCRVVVRYVNQVAAAELVLPDLWRVRGDERLIEDLRTQANVSAAFQYA